MNAIFEQMKLERERAALQAREHVHLQRIELLEQQLKSAENLAAETLVEVARMRGLVAELKP